MVTGPDSAGLPPWRAVVGAAGAALLLAVGIAASTTPWASAAGAPTSSTPDSTRSYDQAFSTVEMSPEQTAALDDRHVDAAEYLAGFERLRSCLAAAGFELVDVAESNHTKSYGVPVDAVDSGVEGACYSIEFEQVDMHWQLDHADTSESTRVMRACLTENGLEPVGDAEAIGEQLKASGIDMTTCGA